MTPASIRSAAVRSPRRASSARMAVASTRNASGSPGERFRVVAKMGQRDPRLGSLAKLSPPATGSGGPQRTPEGFNHVQVPERLAERRRQTGFGASLSGARPGGYIAGESWRWHGPPSRYGGVRTSHEPSPASQARVFAFFRSWCWGARCEVRGAGCGVRGCRRAVSRPGASPRRAPRVCPAPGSARTGCPTWWTGATARTRAGRAAATGSSRDTPPTPSRTG
jgi:hypothetical protein